MVGSSRRPEAGLDRRGPLALTPRALRQDPHEENDNAARDRGGAVRAMLASIAGEGGETSPRRSHPRRHRFRPKRPVGRKWHLFQKLGFFGPTAVSRTQSCWGSGGVLNSAGSATVPPLVLRCSSGRSLDLFPRYPAAGGGVARHAEEFVQTNVVTIDSLAKRVARDLLSPAAPNRVPRR